MAPLLAFVLSFAPAIGCAALVYWLDRYEKEPKALLVAVFGWGAVVAVIGAILAQTTLQGAVSVATGSANAAEVAGTTLFAPLTEESLKGFAVLLVFLVARREFDSVLDGIVYASITALGFAATEDFLYLFGESTQKGMAGLLDLFVVRIIFGIWDHPFYTAFVGIGLALSRLSRATLVRWLAPPAGWAIAVGFHSLHNILATLSERTPALGAVMLLVDWAGWIFMSLLIVVSIYREGRMVDRQLADEVTQGRLTSAQVRTAASSWRRPLARLRAVPQGRAALTRRFYQVCGELALKKEQLATVGDEACNAGLIEQLRAELALLSEQLEGGIATLVPPRSAS